MKIAVFPGSFDPITSGHEDILVRASHIFDKIIVAVGINNSKQSLFSLEDRLKWLEMVSREIPNVEVDSFEGLTAHYCMKKNAKFLVRGLRNASKNDLSIESNRG